jgi:DNA-binding CsgD family transcriptional regulator
MSLDSEMRPPISTRMRGLAAMRLVGELVARLAVAESWEFAAFGRDDDVLLTGSSAQGAVDVAMLRAEVRLQRLRGTQLPYVSTALATDQRHSLFVIFGEFGERISILGVTRGPTGKAFVMREGLGIERFIRQHTAAIATAIFDVHGDVAERLVARREAPIVFTIDAKGFVLSTIDEPEGDTMALRTHFMPLDGELPPVLRPVIGALLERLDTEGPSELMSILPFALVRLAPLRSRVLPASFLVTVEWLRNRASLEVTAAQYSISKRELQVLSAMLRGAAVSEIAAELSISESTVVFHLKRMLKKTLSKNRSELAARMLGYETV